MRVPYAELYEVFLGALAKRGMPAERAALCAKLFADSSADGVPSHGLNRFALFVSAIDRGLVDVHAVPARVAGFGGLERWTGNRGPGQLSAHHSMNRAIELAREHGVGAVGLANTNHWQRGGNYGWQAADAGMIGICWTNTLPNLPAWGSTSPGIGNNPMIIAAPRAGGHIVMDMAMSQFSYGQLAVHRMRGAELPVDGGYNSAGELTRSPAAIEETQRLLPIGFWKGSALSIMLDVVATLLSGGRSTHQVDPNPADETCQSQVFVAFDPTMGGTVDDMTPALDAIIRDLHETGESVRYPGERTLATREQSMREGVAVDGPTWERARSL